MAKITALLTIEGAHYNKICTTLQGKVAYITEPVLKEKHFGTWQFYYELHEYPWAVINSTYAAMLENDKYWK